VSVESLQRSREPRSRLGEPVRVALVGNPNAGKTTLFNALTGLRAKTANFPGTTIERRIGRTSLGEHRAEIVDLPGAYSLTSLVPEERVVREALLGRIEGQPAPHAVVLLIDATNLERNLYLASQVLELGLPTLVALNMVDLAERSAIEIDPDRLAAELGCPVVPVVARERDSAERLRKGLADLVEGLPPEVLPNSRAAARGAFEECAGCPFKARFDWAEEVGGRCTVGRPKAPSGRTDRIDRVLTHPWVGVGAFLSVMFVIFGLIFWIAQYPMDWIDAGFAAAAATAGRWLPEGELQSLIVEGVIGGVGGVLIFLPQICILFLFLSLLEDTGYLARAAFVMDRLMRRVGLPGRAFVPMISAHACAVPAIMSTRIIEDRRDRLVTILVLPLFSCSARIPVYAMVTALLFPHRPGVAAAVFTGAYTLGIASAIGAAFVLKRTILPGESRPLVLELPGYKLPSLRTALLATWDRARIFLRRAGTIILAASIALWVLAHYPRQASYPEAERLTRQAEAVAAAGDLATATELRSEAERAASRAQLEGSVAGRAGRFVEPVLEPLGYDWQIGVGILSSLIAREVIVSTLAVVYGVGEAAVDEEPASLYTAMRSSRRSDGSPVFNTAASASLLVFYVLAMQCLSTLAVTRRETNSWRWPVFQWVYMTALAYVAALITYQGLTLLA
jgi:ferrous iron transport protein B